MTNRTNTRVTIDIPTVDHKKLKMLAAFHSKSMRDIFIEILERGLKEYEQECPHNHEPNETTKKALEDIKKRKGLNSSETIKELFKKLDT